MQFDISQIDWNAAQEKLLPLLTPEAILTQRVAGAVLIAFDFIAGSFAPFQAAGRVLLGASLIQEALNIDPLCTQKVILIVAGFLMMKGGISGWSISGLLWWLSRYQVPEQKAKELIEAGMNLAQNQLARVSK